MNQDQLMGEVKIEHEEDLDIQEDSKEGVLDEASNEKKEGNVQYDITSYGADYDVEGLVKRLNRGDILIPAFQRNYVWKIREASKFIESLLLGLPVPSVFFAKESGSNKLLVIDGQQRLKTLQFFYNNVFNPSEEDKKTRVFRLLDVQERFDGLTFNDLKEGDQVKLNDAIIHAITIKQESPERDDTSMYHVYDRLNSNGRKLTPQEIRTAIDHGKFVDLLRNINMFEPWRSIYGKQSDRLKDQELILRFLALYFNASKYKRPMNEFLNIFSRENRQADDAFLRECDRVFTQTLNFVYEALGSKAFKPSSSLNAAVFDSVMYGVAKNLDTGLKERRDSFVKKYTDLLNDPDYVKAITSGTADEKSVQTRLEKAVQKFSSM